jgi:hypothetical protein
MLEGRRMPDRKSRKARARRKRLRRAELVRALITLAQVGSTIAAVISGCHH